MSVKRIFLFFAILAAIFIPWYKKYFSYFFYQNVCNESASLIDISKLKNIHNINICNHEDLKNLIKIISQYDKNLEFIHLLNPEQQLSVYKNIIEDYIINAYAVEKYLQDKNITRSEEFSRDKKIYIKIMENNFNIGFFKKYLSENINIEDVFAEEYYNKNKLKEFARYPFVKQTPLINARIIKIDGEKEYKIYEDILLNNKKECIILDSYNPYSNDGILSSTLLRMKNNDFVVVKLENDQKFMVYKINEIEPIWNLFGDISHHVKSYLQEKLINEEASRIVEEIKMNCNITICEENLKKYIQDNNINYASNINDIINRDDVVSDSSGVSSMSESISI